MQVNIVNGWYHAPSEIQTTDRQLATSAEWDIDALKIQATTAGITITIALMQFSYNEMNFQKKISLRLN